MARLVIDARESGTSTGRYIDKLIEHLHSLEPNFEVIVLTKSKRLDYIRQIAPSFTAVKSNYKEFSLAEQLGFAWQLYKLKANLVHFNAPQQPVLYFKPSITTVHDLTTARFNNPAKNALLFKFKQQVYKMVVWWVAHKAKKIIAISNYTKQDLISFSGINSSKVEVIYEAADKITEPAKEVADLKGRPFLMYVGRPTPHKNLTRLIDAFQILAQTNNQLVLVLAGKLDLNYQKIRERVANLNLTSQVIFTGFISEAELRWLYENCQAYVFPSLSEGFGLPGLEAMAQGAPVVAAQATALPEIYEQAAYYFDPENTADMANRIQEVLDDKKLQVKLVAKGYEQAAKYSWHKTAEQTLGVYKSLL